MISDKKVCWVLLLYLLLGLHLYGQRTIAEIRIDLSGLGNVNEKYVRNNMRTKKGDEYHPSRLNEDVVALMKTGKFESVSVLEEDIGTDRVKLTFEVKTFPLVTEVELFLFRRQLRPGENEIKNVADSDLVDAEYLRIKESSLLKDIRMKKGQQFNELRMHADEKALKEAYLKKGYYPVVVEGQKKLGGSVRYIISEGEKFRIGRGEMVFESTDLEPLSFKHKQLKKEVKTRQRRVWYNPISWFMDDGKIKPKVFQEDVESLETFYRDEGYLDVQVGVNHGADKVLTSTEYSALRETMFQKRVTHSMAVEKLAEAERRLGDLAEGDNESEFERLVDVAESRSDDAEDALDDAEDAFEDFMDENDYVPFVFSILEGPQYKVGGIKIEYGRVVKNKFEEVTTEQLPEFKPVIPQEVLKSMISSEEGEVFHPNYLRSEDPEDSDQEIIKSAYGNRAYIDAKVSVLQEPNLKDNTMDIVFQIREGEHFFEENGELKWDRQPIRVGLVKIEGNAKTKDFVIRRELSISPGEPFDLGKMRNSRRRINGLKLFSGVLARPESTDPKERDESTIENLVIGVRETNTGRLQLGGGYSTDSGAFAHVVLSQENFDIMRWRRPYFWQGAGQKVRLRTIAGGRFNHYEVDFEEPWFRGRKLKFKTSMYTREMAYFHNKFDVEETGIRLGLERAIFGDESFRGKIRYTIEEAGLVDMKSTASTELLAEQGMNLYSVISPGIVYDTRGDGFLPKSGQRSSIDLEYAPDELASEKEFYGLHLKSAWYFKGLGKGHVLEFVSQAKSYDSLESGQPVPYLYRPYLGGSRTLRAYPYRQVGPRGSEGDYIGGNTMMHATLEYSVPTPFKLMRLATFYDVGVVNSDSYDFNTTGYNDDYGFGVRLDIPFMGPIRLDYAIPITDDGYNGGSGRFSINMGYTTTF